MIARLLQTFADWALSKNASGPYCGEDDPRWAYVIETDHQPYLTRVFLTPKVLGYRAMLHHFHRPDADRYLHNHPWRWALSFVLSGAYDEERLVPNPDPLSSAGGTFVKRLVRRFNTLTDRDYHRVTRLRGDVWTLFITGPRIQDWGFLIDGEHVPWREFLKDR